MAARTRLWLPPPLVLAFLIWLCATAVLGAEGFYETSGVHSYILHELIEITNKGRIDVTEIRVKLLVDTDGGSAYQSTERYTVDPPLQRTWRDERGNLFGELTVDRLRPGEHCHLNVERRILHGAISFHDSIYRLGEDYRSFLAKRDNARYLRAETKIESDSPAIANKAGEFRAIASPAERARAIFEFVNLYLTYDTSPTFANQGALSAILSGRGVCDEYATLFVALCRASGIPARMVSGYWVTNPFRPDRWVDLSGTGHAWAEFYLPDAGWVPAELAHILTVNGERQPSLDYFAALDGDDRHFITAYPEAKNVSVSYMFTPGSGSSPHPELKLETTEELVRQLPD